MLILSCVFSEVSKIYRMPDPRSILFFVVSFLATAYGHLHAAVPQEYLDNPEKDISHLDEEMRMRITHARFGSVARNICWL